MALRPPRVTRRGVLIGGAAGGGLLVAWGLTPTRYPLALPPREGETAYNAWLRIARDGTVTVAVPQLEMGQGVTTVLAQVAAMELGADWRQIAVAPPPPSGAYANVPLAARWALLWMPAFAGLAQGDDPWFAAGYAQRNRFAVTADGTALAAYEQPLREAACAVRTLLAQAAADRWDVDWTECTVAGGAVTHGRNRAGFGELAEDAARFTPPRTLPLGPPATEPPVANAVSGPLTPWPRLDAPGKVAGAPVFAGDVRLPGMVFAAIRHAPRARSMALGRYDGAIADTLPQVRLVKGPDWLAATAPTWWAAEQALARIAPTFVVDGLVDTQPLEAALDRAVRKGRTHRIATVGDPDGVMAGQPTLVRRYDLAPALHAGIETASCTARLRDGRMELWLAGQAPEAARRAVAGAIGFRLADVVLYPVQAGGSFDARLEHEHAVQAALIAREMGKPVQLVWSRWQEHVAARPRPPAAAILWARTNPDGGDVLAWKTRIATPAAAREFGARLLGGESAGDAMAGAAGAADPLALAGALPPYRLAHASVDHVPVQTGIAAGRMRGNGHAMTAFFTESFIDELARAGGREPLSYRIAMLGGDVRLAECLQRCAALAGWDAGADASGQGLACHRMGDDDAAGAGRIAVIATARRDESGVRVDRITAVADIGRIVNRDVARQQIEGGLVFGMGLALGSSTTWARGLPVAERLADMSLPMLGNTPEIVVELVESTASAFDPGELGVVAVAPAIANALHSATGERFRKLPFFAEEV